MGKSGDFPPKTPPTTDQPIARVISKDNRVCPEEKPTLVANFGPEDQVLKCPYCQNFVNTKRRTKFTLKTHLTAFFMSLCCCCLCFGCPYCMDFCKDIYHYCPECNGYLGSYHY